MHYLAAHWILPVCREPFADGFVAIEGDRLAAVGRLTELPDTLAAPLRQTLDGPTGALRLITPGLINLHTHLELSEGPRAPRAPGETMTDWLLAVIRRKGQPSPEAIGGDRLEAATARCRRGAEMSLATGVSCVNDISTHGESLAVLADAGMRGVVCMEFFHAQAGAGAVDAIVERYFREFEASDGLASARGRLRTGISPHSPYAVSARAWRAVARACRPAIIHCHGGESLDEWRWIRGEPSPLKCLHLTVLGREFSPEPPPGARPRSPIGYLDAHGLLDEATVVAHGVFATAADRQAMARHGATLAHCPRSNLALSDRTISWPAWQDSGIATGLGSDSLLSAPDLDIRAEARVAQTLHGWDAEETLARVTSHSARVLGWGDVLGVIQPGAWADLTLWRAQAQAGGSASALWLHPTTQADAVWVAGRPIWNALPSPRQM